MSDQLLQEILDRVKEAGEQAHANAKSLVVLSERMDHHCNTEHKEFDGLLDTVREGRAAAKIISILLAFLAATASAVAWIIDHLRIH